MANVIMKGDKTALVDDQDMGLISPYKWKYNVNGYAYAQIYLGTFDGKIKYRNVYLHRLIMGEPEGKQVDHIDGDRLNNKRSNLRVCTRRENLQNRSANKGTANRYKGVRQRKDVKIPSFEAMIKIDGKQKSLGSHRTLEDAARAYNKAALELFGEFARLNVV